MGRIIAIDYGTKRCGIAATDPLRIIAAPLTAVHTQDLFEFLTTYIAREQVDALVVGRPLQKDGTPPPVEQHIKGFVRKFASGFPQVRIFRFDERFTSVMAQQTLLQSGASKKDRRVKEHTDTISAGIILQSFMESKEYRDWSL